MSRDQKKTAFTNLEVFQRAAVKWQLISRMLRVFPKLESSVLGDGAFRGSKVTCDQVEQSGLSSSVRAEDGYSGVHVDTNVQVLVEIVLLFAAVGESDRIQSDDRWWKFRGIFEDEAVK